MKPSPLRFTALVVLLLVHSAVTYMAAVEYGFIGVFEQALANWGTAQVFSDLGVCIVLIDVWMLIDGRRRGVLAWPFVVLSLPLGSFAPLAYLLRREWRAMRGAGEGAAA